MVNAGENVEVEVTSQKFKKNLHVTQGLLILSENKGQKRYQTGGPTSRISLKYMDRNWKTAPRKPVKVESIKPSVEI